MKHTCKNCGKEISRIGNRKRVFCSRTCMKTTSIARYCKCIVCGNPFRAYSSRVGKYCSKKCKGIGSRLPLGTGKNCGKKFKTRPGGGKNSKHPQKYCSRKCFSEKRRAGKIVQCKQCGKNVYIHKYRLKPANFCSVACLNLYQGRNKIEHICKTCGKIFKRSPSDQKFKALKYCSMACRTACPEWRRNSVIAANLKQQNSKQPSSLEIEGSGILREIGVPFLTQVLIFNKFTVDVMLDKLNIIIQWDGDYWHGFINPKDPRHKKRMGLDKSQDAYMKKCGYIVLRFWEHEVNKKRDKVSAIIKRTIQIRQESIEKCYTNSPFSKDSLSSLINDLP